MGTTAQLQLRRNERSHPTSSSLFIITTMRNSSHKQLEITITSTVNYTITDLTPSRRLVVSKRLIIWLVIKCVNMIRAIVK